MLALLNHTQATAATAIAAAVLHSNGSNGNDRSSSSSISGAKCYSPYDRRLSHTKAGDKSASVDGAQVALHSASHKNSDANSPDEAQHTRGIQPANTITNQEGTIAKMQVVIR